MKKKMLIDASQKDLIRVAMIQESSLIDELNINIATDTLLKWSRTKQRIKYE